MIAPPDECPSDTHLLAATQLPSKARLRCHLHLRAAVVTLFAVVPVATLLWSRPAASVALASAPATTSAQVHPQSASAHTPHALPKLSQTRKAATSAAPGHANGKREWPLPPHATQPAEVAEHFIRLLAIPLALVTGFFIGRWVTTQPTTPRAMAMAMTSGSADPDPSKDLEAGDTALRLNPGSRSSPPSQPKAPSSRTALNALSPSSSGTQLLDRVLEKLDPPQPAPPAPQPRPRPKARSVPAVSKTPVADSIPVGPYDHRSLSRSMQPHGYIPASPYGWAVLQEKLQTSNVREVSAARLKAGADDFVVLDLRDPDDFAKGHISGARSVLLFRPNTKKGPNLRNLLLMMTGSPLTEENPEFMEEVERIVPERKARIVLVCNLEEGSLDGNAKNPRGCISRSLLAAFRLVDEGYTDLRYLERGMPSWEAEGYPLVTDDACEQGSM